MANGNVVQHVLEQFAVGFNREEDLSAQGGQQSLKAEQFSGILMSFAKRDRR